MAGIKVLQCGYPKSGNFLFAKIIHLALRAAGKNGSFKQKSGVAELVDRLAADYKLHPDISHLDTFSIENGCFVLFFPHPGCRRLHPDPELVVATSNHLWTHDPVDTVRHEWFRSISHYFYLMRDGRDAVNSLVHHLARPEVHGVEPAYALDTVEKIYNDMELMGKYIARWSEHILSYYAYQENMKLLRFEDYISDPKKCIDSIIQYVDLDINVEDILNKTNFDVLNKKAPKHLRKGKVGDWKNYFNEDHKELFKKYAGEALIRSGYEKDKKW